MTDHRIWVYYFTVDHVHDGDTLYGVLDLGLGLHLGPPFFGVRFLGINAPELGTPEGAASLAFLETLVKPGDSLRIASVKWDKYGGRVDATVWRDGDGTSLNDQLLAAGMAVPYP